MVLLFVDGVVVVRCVLFVACCLWVIHRCRFTILSLCAVCCVHLLLSAGVIDLFVLLGAACFVLMLFVAFCFVILVCCLLFVACCLLLVLWLRVVCCRVLVVAWCCRGLLFVA